MIYLEDLATAVAVTLFCATVLVVAMIFTNPEWLEVLQ